jgi:histidinol-phosphate aminotransferase
VPAEWITLGNGSNDILELAAGAFLAPGRSCVYAQYSFAVYALATQARGAQAIVVAARDFGHDLEAMLAAIRADTRLMYVANPNNPTGTFIDAAMMESFLGRVPPGVVVVLDEAYNEYLPPEDRFDSTIWVKRYPNLLVSRTFSKAYGLAGLRVGYGLAQPALTDLLNRVRQPFNVNTPAQAAALAALGDQAFLQQSYELNRAGLREFEAAFDTLGLSYVPSRANFVLVKVGAAARVYQELLKRGVIVRPVGNYGLPEWLRVSVGLPAENATFLAALPPALAAARG